MKYIKKFNEMLDPMGSWEPKKEITNVGFLDSDLLSTMIMDNNEGTLYLFNWGSYGRIDKYFYEIKNENDFTDIEDWLSNILNDYNYDVFTNVINIELIDKSDLDNLELLNKYPDNEIGNNVIKINFKLQ